MDRPKALGPARPAPGRVSAVTGACDHGEFEIDHTAEHLDHLESDRAEVRAKINLMQLTLDGATIEDFKRLVEILLVE